MKITRILLDCAVAFISMYEPNQDEVCFVMEYEIIMLLAPKIIKRIPSITLHTAEMANSDEKNHLVLLHSGYNATGVSASPKQPERAKRSKSLIFCTLEISGWWCSGCLAQGKKIKKGFSLNFKNYIEDEEAFQQIINRTFLQVSHVFMALCF